MTNKDIRQTIADNIRAAMESHDSIRSQTALANASKIAQSTIGRILRAEVSAAADTLDAIAEALGVSQARLVTPPDKALDTVLATSSEEFFELLLDKCSTLSIKEQARLAEKLDGSIRDYAAKQWALENRSETERPLAESLAKRTGVAMHHYDLDDTQDGTLYALQEKEMEIRKKISDLKEHISKFPNEFYDGSATYERMMQLHEMLGGIEADIAAAKKENWGKSLENVLKDLKKKV